MRQQCCKVVWLLRWIKFEEDVEEGGNRWSKPHVATLSLHSLFELRSLLLNGTVVLDMEAATLEQVADLTLDHMLNSGVLAHDCREKVGCETLCVIRTSDTNAMTLQGVSSH